jgi:hypothetical protein
MSLTGDATKYSIVQIEANCNSFVVASNVTITANTAGNALVTDRYRELYFTLNLTALSGGPFLFFLEGSDDGGTTWFPLPNSSSVPLWAVGTTSLLVTAPHGALIRTHYMLYGTSPSATFTLNAQGK